MSGWFGLLGTLLPLLVTLVSAGGLLQGRSLWTLSLALHLVSWACFLWLTGSFYTGHLAQDATILSPSTLMGSPWSGEATLSWTFPTSLLSLAACSVIVCFHFIAQDTIEHSRATLAGLSAYLTCLLGASGADHLMLFSIFLGGSILPRMIFTGIDTRDGQIAAVKETAFLYVIATLSLLLCVLVFAVPFRASLQDWFVLTSSGYVVESGSIGFALLLLAAALIAGILPFHGNARRVFEMGSMERAVPLALSPLFGFTLLFRFGPTAFPEEFKGFGYAFVGLFSLGVAYCAIGFLGSRHARDRIFWLQQLMCSFIAVGFFTLTGKGWHGALVLLFFQSLAVPFFLLVLTCHERRARFLPIREIGRYPAFALSTALAVLFALFLPLSVGFYGILLVIWSLVSGPHWPLPFVILSIPIIALAGIRLMFFRLGDSELPEQGDLPEFTDLKRLEIFAILPLGLSLLLFGLVPKLVLGPIGASISGVLRGLGFKD